MNEHRRPRFRFDLATGVVCTLGLLFWARLIVITDMPRTAVADEAPADVEDEHDEASGSDNNEASATGDADDPRVPETSASAEMADRP